MSSTNALAALRRSIPAPKPHKFSKKRLEAYKFAPATPRGRSAYAQRQLKTPDPLLNSVDAQVFSVNDTARALFIVRPPPTVVPPNISYSSSGDVTASTSSLTHPLALPTASIASLPSPSLRHPTDEQSSPLIGTSRRHMQARVQLTDEEVDRLRRARLHAPRVSRAGLAKRFNCHPDVVARLQYDPHNPASMALARQSAARRAMSRESREDRYLDYQGDITVGRQLTLAERAWRRSLW